MGCSSSSNPNVAASQNEKEKRMGSPTGSSNSPPLDSKYDLTDEVLGEGGYAIVKKGSVKETNEKVAIKIVTRKGMSSEDEKSLKEEVDIIKNKLDHPHITKAYDLFEDNSHFYVCMEFLEGGELFDRIVKKHFYNEKEARDLVQLLLNTLSYLHKNNIAHRDLKPENLLLKDKNNDWDVKIADFGFAVECDGDNISNVCGTPSYMAPEILRQVKYGFQADMWSFGVILYILLGGYPPFHDDNQKALFKKILRADYKFHPAYWKTVSEEAKDLISKLLTLDPKERLTADQALNHPWMLKDKKTLEATAVPLDELRKYQATRKLKKGVRAVLAVNKMKRLMEGAKSMRAAESEKTTDEESRPAATTEST